MRKMKPVCVTSGGDLKILQSTIDYVGYEQDTLLRCHNAHATLSREMLSRSEQSWEMAIQQMIPLYVVRMDRSHPGVWNSMSCIQLGHVANAFLDVYLLPDIWGKPPLIPPPHAPVLHPLYSVSTNPKMLSKKRGQSSPSSSSGSLRKIIDSGPDVADAG
jgi:hypothetical protein